MSKEIDEYKSTVPANPEDLLEGLKHMQQTIPDTVGVMPLMRLKNGRFSYGQENIEVEENSKWAVNPTTIQHGWCCWSDVKGQVNELLGEVMVPFNATPPAKSELQDLGFEWSPQNSVQLQCLDGEDQGLSVLYKSSSMGMRNMMKTLIAQIIKQVSVDKDHPVPVVYLDTDSYNHKVYGETFVPVLEVVDWIDYNGLPVQSTDDNKDSEAPEQASKAVTSEDAAPSPSGEASTTRRRRRRSR